MKNRFNNFIAEHPYLISAGTLTLTLLILFLTLSPADFISGNRVTQYDKTGHVLMFGSWTYLFGLYLHIRRPEQSSLFTVFLVGVLFGIFVEVLQYALPFERSAELFDIAFDTIGAFLAVLLLRKTLDID